MPENHNNGIYFVELEVDAIFKEGCKVMFHATMYDVSSAHFNIPSDSEGRPCGGFSCCQHVYLDKPKEQTK